ncbi:MAG: substrate-binding domain-containing protein, partial [Cetobacterium sp.]
IIGHDNIELIDYFYPRLSSVKQNFEEITLNALEYLIGQIEDKKKVISENKSDNFIIERETT